MPSITFANDNKIASVIEISGDAIALTEDGDERELEIFDNLFIEDEIFIGDDSSVTIQFNDNTTIILKEFTSLNIKEFENSEARAAFKLKLGKGEIIIESGSIFTNPTLSSSSSSLYSQQKSIEHIKERLVKSSAKSLFMRINIILRKLS